MRTRDRISHHLSCASRRLPIVVAGSTVLLLAGTVQATPLPPRLTLKPVRAQVHATSPHMLRKLPVRAVLEDAPDLKAAYNKALGQYNNLELDAAIAGLDAALAGAAADDPMTAPLRMLKGVVIFSNTGKADTTGAAFVEAVKADYNVTIPSELRSPDLEKILDKARTDSGVSAPTEAVRHQAPDGEAACGSDVVFVALAKEIPDGGQVAFYWRQVGASEFETAAMDIFGNVASVTLTASDHGDKPVEYFFYVFDSANKELGNNGDQDNPLRLDVACKKAEAPKPPPPEDPKPKSGLPRVFIGLNVGTGFGIARGVADQTYQQLSPGSYTPSDYACAIARWQAGSAALPGSGAELQAALGGLAADRYAPYSLEEIGQAYIADDCNARHPVKTGMASAPFHFAPEVGFRIGRSLVLSVFGRLQFVTGSKVFRDDPKLDLTSSYTQEVLNPNPEGVRTKPGFTGAGGVKVKYFLGQDEHKFRLFVGGFLGGGFSRLRVPMGFANDRNGNSIADDKEQSAVGTSQQCQPIWPYSGGCAGGDAGMAAQGLAGSVVANTDRATRIDTVRIGGGFLGGAFGFNYQIVKNFALSAELQLGVWFPRTSSFLIDFNLGPVITF